MCERSPSSFHLSPLNQLHISCEYLINSSPWQLVHMGIVPLPFFLLKICENINRHYLCIAFLFFYCCLFATQDNPADFSFYFDTSRRRTCYLAPERFCSPEFFQETSVIGGVQRSRVLVHQMDIFSLGSVRSNNIRFCEWHLVDV